MRIIFSLLFLISLTANCFASTYIREYAYEPGEQIRKVQAREEAMEIC